MFVRIFNTALILFAVYMGLKQGYAMLSLKPAMLNLFSKWNFSNTAIMVNGVVTMLSAFLILFPKTFIWGNFIMAAAILLLICFHLIHKDLKGAAIEVPFMLLNLLLIFLSHPFAKAV